MSKEHERTCKAVVVALLRSHQTLEGNRVVDAKIIHQVGGGKLEYSEANMSSEEGLKSCVITNEALKIVCGPGKTVPAQAGGS